MGDGHQLLGQGRLREVRKHTHTHTHTMYNLTSEEHSNIIMEVFGVGPPWYTVPE